MQAYVKTWSDHALTVQCLLQAPAGEVHASAAQDSNPKLAGESSYGPDDMTCAICLEQIQLEDTAYVKGCEHAYCGQ